MQRMFQDWPTGDYALLLAIAVTTFCASHPWLFRVAHSRYEAWKVIWSAISIGLIFYGFLTRIVPVLIVLLQGL